MLFCIWQYSINLLKIVFPIFQIISLLMNELFLFLFLTRCISCLAAGPSWAWLRLCKKREPKAAPELQACPLPSLLLAFFVGTVPAANPGMPCQQLDKENTKGQFLVKHRATGGQKGIDGEESRQLGAGELKCLCGYKCVWAAPCLNFDHMIWGCWNSHNFRHRL